jgi:hypothetical protein
MSNSHEEPMPRLSAKLWRHESNQALHQLHNQSLSDLEGGGCDPILDAAEAPAGRSMRSRHHTRVVDHDKGKTPLTGHGRPDVRGMQFWKRRSA